MMILASAFDLPQGRLLALDLGQARTGVAVCDELGMLATPVGVLPRHATRAEDYREIATFAARQRVVGLLVGIPMDDAGEPGPQARWVRRYTGRMAAAVSLPIAFWNETLSTTDAMQLLVESGGRTPADAAAAAVILTSFLDARRRGRA